MNKLLTILLVFILVMTPKTNVLAAEEQINHNSLFNQTVTNLHTQLTAKTFETILNIPTDTLQPVTVGKALADEYNTANPATASLKQLADQLVTEKFGKGQFSAFDAIVTHESTWNPQAVNKLSGACGLGQALPCSKMTDHSAKGQISWTVSYIAERYGTPTAAWAFWKAHGWY